MVKTSCLITLLNAKMRKSKLSTSHIPDFTCPFVLHSDASDTAIGAVVQAGKETVTNYWSCQLTKQNFLSLIATITPKN